MRRPSRPLMWIKSWIFHLVDPEGARELRRLLKDNRRLRALARQNPEVMRQADEHMARFERARGDRANQ